MSCKKENHETDSLGLNPVPNNGKEGTIMLRIKQFAYGEDNFGYLIYGCRQAMAIDGGAASAILSFINDKQLELRYVTNTHSHPDHLVGNRALLEVAAGAEFLGFETMVRDGFFELENSRIMVMHTPGHSQDSVCFYFDDILISGDTLFNGKVGRCFTGDHEGFLQSVKKILELPGHTRVYAGHDYVMEYIAFSRLLDPDNPHIDEYIRKYDPNHLFYTLEEEINVNPYLRFNDEKITFILKKRGLAADTESDRWESLLSLM
jgi:hydroxyacylglutathione hydrolase